MLIKITLVTNQQLKLIVFIVPKKKKRRKKRLVNELQTLWHTQRETPFITGNEYIFYKWVRLYSNM